MKFLAFSSPIISAYVQSDLFGKLIFLSLFVLSILSWIILIQKIIISKKIDKLNLSFEKKIVSSSKENLLNLNFNYENEFPFFTLYSEMKHKTIELLNKNKFFNKNINVYLTKSDMELIQNHLFNEISKEIKSFEKNLFILPTIVTLGPFIGLLGTVWGILLTFNSLQTSSLSNGNSKILSSLAMALGTTIIGLVVAIPALIAYNYLRNKLKNSNHDMEKFANDMLINLEIQYKKVEIE